MGATVERFDFDARAVDRWSRGDRRHMNWPVVYVIDDLHAAPGPGSRVSVYVGESLSAATRMRQHLGLVHK